jgi:hypothetical protein
MFRRAGMPLIAPVIGGSLAVVGRAVTRAASTPVPSAAAPDAMRMLGQLRTALLARKVTGAGLAAIYRYRDANDVRRDVEGLRAAGLIDTTGDGAVQATERGRAVLTEMYKVSAEVAGELWAGQEGSLAGLTDLGTAGHAALATGGRRTAMAPPYNLRAAAGLLPHPVVGVALPHATHTPRPGKPPGSPVRP